MTLETIIVGLGNPGIQYQWSPHSLGFQLVDLLAAKAGGSWKGAECQAITSRVCLNGLEVLLAKPQTFMNLSGNSVKELLRKYLVATDHLIVTCDDIALPFGKIRIRRQGSSGGHLGLQSIIDSLQSETFVRVRLGISPAIPCDDIAAYVLRPIPVEMRDAVEAMLLSGKEALEVICSSGLEAAMNEFNRQQQVDEP